jgi:hypothetical protein
VAVVRGCDRACEARKSDAIINSQSGAVAQSGERVVRNDEVSGSIPLSSTNQTLGFTIT